MKDELRNKVNYDNLSEFGKFIHAYKFTIKQVGLKGISGKLTKRSLWQYL